MLPDSLPVSAHHCPWCDAENACAVELERATGEGQGPCWCTTARIPPELIARLPAASKDKACICSKCVANFQQLQAPQGESK